MRADRLVAGLLLMQQRGRITAAELAAELEVSVPTARRDLEAMAAAGIPVYPQPGRGGGWQLVGGARTDLSGLTATEAEALFLLVGPAAAVSDEARAALRKLVGALPSTFRTAAQTAAAAVVIDPARWGERGTDRPTHVAALQAAVVRRERLRLIYAGRRREQSERLVDPWGLVEKGETWYLLAGTDRGRRTFRVDRVVAVEPTGEAADRPADLDLAAAWREVAGEIEDRRARTWAVLTLPGRFLPVLQDRFGRHCVTEEWLADGRVRARVAAPTPLDLGRDLAGWGGLVEVLGPPEVRAVLAQIGAELVERYDAGG
ncbi:helix-turn-helix transcriptional regulator [Nocardioides sp. SYSU DS0651]|uniref:helix-turn-helix transcriptional regulator n=1 Tax=Nocardioides sp. SYSU DS0651 TaxID=3415955 RepID=UPI003F4C8776